MIEFQLLSDTQQHPSFLGFSVASCNGVALSESSFAFFASRKLAIPRCGAVVPVISRTRSSSRRGGSWKRVSREMRVLSSPRTNSIASARRQKKDSFEPLVRFVGCAEMARRSLLSFLTYISTFPPFPSLLPIFHSFLSFLSIRPPPPPSSFSLAFSISICLFLVYIRLSIHLPVHLYLYVNCPSIYIFIISLCMFMHLRAFPFSLSRIYPHSLSLFIPLFRPFPSFLYLSSGSCWSSPILYGVRRVRDAATSQECSRPVHLVHTCTCTTYYSDLESCLRCRKPGSILSVVQGRNKTLLFEKRNKGLAKRRSGRGERLCVCVCVRSQTARFAHWISEH